MTGRILGIKKSFILRTLSILMLFAFITSTYFTTKIYQIYDLWFYNFCLALGIVQLVKSILFKIDSSFYFGTLLILVGISGYIFWLTQTIDYAIFYISVSFMISSIALAIYYKQRFHIIIAFSIFFVEIYGILLKKSLITLPIFVAFVSIFLLLLILEITLSFIWRK